MSKPNSHPVATGAWQRGQTTVAFLALGTALAIGLVLSAWIVASSLERIKLAGDKITVKGYAEERVVSDAGTWRAIVSVRAADLPTAYGKLEYDSARVVKYIESVAGADAKSLQQGTANTQTLFELSGRYADGTRDWVRTQQTVRILVDERRADPHRGHGRITTDQ